MSQAEWVKKDYYATLGVAKSASAADIKKAYRKLAQKYHPDANPGDKSAEERFKEISHAKDVLTDASKRREYDRIREMMSSGAGFGGYGPSGGFRSVRVDDVADIFGTRSGAGGAGFEDLLGGLFGAGFRRAASPARGSDVETEASLSFVDALNGATVQLKVSGAGGERNIKARIPPLVKSGDRIKLAGKGMPGNAGGPPGDLYVKVSVKPHTLFGRKGKDVTLQLPVTFAEAALGCEVDVPTLNGKPVKLKIPAGTPSGKTFRVKGRGGSEAARSDLLVSVQVDVPTKLSREEKDLVKRLGELQASPRRPVQGVANVG